MITLGNYKKLAIKSLAVLGLWAIVALLLSSITILQEIQAGAPVSFARIFAFEFVCISPWIICTPAIIWLARSYRFDKEILYKSAAVHLLAAVVIFSFHSVVQSNAVFYFFDYAFSWSYIQVDFLGFLDIRVILYVGIVLAVYAVDFQKKNRAIRLRKSKLKAELSRAKFHALLNQIQPDFLLNTIDAIEERLDHDLEEAEEILTDFSDLLRIMLNSADREEVLVQNDLDSYALYVSIWSKRLGIDIQKETNIDADCYQVLIPSFLLLIPLFEEMIESPDFNPAHIKTISYNVSRSGDNIDLGINIKGDKMGIKDISLLSQRSRVDKLVVSLKKRYGEKMKFQTKTEDAKVHIGLRMPYIIEGNALAVAEV